MTMAVDSSQQRFPLNFEPMSNYPSHHTAPQFTNPWAGSSQTASSQPSASPSMYLGDQSGMHHASLGLDNLRHTQQQQHQPHPLQLPHPIQHHHHHRHLEQSPTSQHQQLSSHGQQPRHDQTQRPSHQQPLPPAPPTQPLHRSAANGIPSVSMAYGTGAMTVTASAGGSPHSRGGVGEQVYVGPRSDLMSLPQDVLSLSRIAGPGAPSQQAPSQPGQVTVATTTTGGYADPSAAYTSAPSPIHPAYPTAGATPYDQMGYAPVRTAAAAAGNTAAPFSLGPAPSDTVLDAARRLSQSDSVNGDNRRGFQDALEASHGILSLSQDTPRPITYGSNPGGGRSARGSGDSYGFPSAHSTSSSVSSTGFSGFYGTSGGGGGGSIDSSVSDYSTTGSDIESVASRAARHSMPRAFVGLSGAPPAVVPPPPAPQSMMGQFSSKLTSTAQKKHKCKVCDKRFTRPSSLQTHMYSHTGEKREFVVYLILIVCVLDPC